MSKTRRREKRQSGESLTAVGRPLMPSASQFSAHPTAITRRKKLARKKKELAVTS